MAGRKRIDMIDEKVARLERERQTEPLDAWLATLTVDQLDALERTLTTTPEPIERRIASGVPPIDALKGIL